MAMRLFKQERAEDQCQIGTSPACFSLCHKIGKRKHEVVPNLKGWGLSSSPSVFLSFYSSKGARRVQQDLHKHIESLFSGRAVTNRVTFCGL